MVAATSLIIRCTWLAKHGDCNFQGFLIDFAILLLNRVSPCFAQFIGSLALVYIAALKNSYDMVPLLGFWP